MTKLRRLETVQRVKELGWAAGQGVLFLAFLVVAIVLGRGGSLERLVQGDVAAAFAGDNAAGALGIEDTRVSRRVLASGTAIVVVTGFVHNQTDQGVPAARVDVRFGDVDASAPPAASGWAWSAVDGVDVAALPDAPSAPALSLRLPPSSSLAPGDRAPFVVLAPAPPDGARVRLTATNVGGATASTGAPPSSSGAAVTPPATPSARATAKPAATPAATAKPAAATKPLKGAVLKPLAKPKPKPQAPAAPATP